MNALEPPDSHLVNAASGWIELGLPAEAERELAQVDPTQLQHPQVLMVLWELYVHQERWEAALVVASKLLESDQSRPTGWINRSYALHGLRRTAEAHAALLPAEKLFPSVGVIPYNLACYACQLGDLPAARTWLRKAMKIDGRAVVLERARTDEDLLPLVPELGGI